MLSYFAAILTVAAVLEGVQADNTYAYHFKVTQYLADMALNMERGIHCQVETVSKMLQEHSQFRKTIEEYRHLIETARLTASRLCPTLLDVAKLKGINATFEASRDECLKETECKDKMAAAAQDMVSSIQTIDADAQKEEEACADENCKQKVYHEMHEKIFNQFKKDYPGLRVTADQALSNSECTSAFIKCMVNKNSDNLRQMYAGIAKLEVCLGHRSRPSSSNGLLASLSNRLEFNSPFPK